MTDFKNRDDSCPLSDLDRQCAAYLKGRPGLEDLMEKIKDKYQSLGKVGGCVVLETASLAEKDFLRGLLRKDFTGRTSLRFSLKAFEGALGEGRFAGICLGGVLEAYYMTALPSKKEQKKAQSEKREDFFRKAARTCRRPDLISYLDALACRRTRLGERWLLDGFSSSDQLVQQLGRLEDLLGVLALREGRPSPLSPQEGLLLPLAAARCCRDPHALDPDQPLRKLFLYFLAYWRGADFPADYGAEQKSLEEAGLVTDWGHRTVRIYGFEAYDKEDRPLLWRTFFERKEALVLSLDNLRGVAKIVPLTDQVLLSENPSVFSYLLKERPHLGQVSVSGQVNRAVSSFMDRVVPHKTPFFYHGDFDPEGLLIAARLLMAYPYLSLLDYSPKAYQASLSDQPLSPSRLKQLDQLDQLDQFVQFDQLDQLKGEDQQASEDLQSFSWPADLLAMRDLLHQERRAGYEENILKEMLESLEDLARRQGKDQ